MPLSHALPYRACTSTASTMVQTVVQDPQSEQWAHPCVVACDRTLLRLLCRCQRMSAPGACQAPMGAQRLHHASVAAAWCRDTTAPCSAETCSQQGGLAEPAPPALSSSPGLCPCAACPQLQLSPAPQTLPLHSGPRSSLPASACRAAPAAAGAHARLCAVEPVHTAHASHEALSTQV